MSQNQTGIDMKDVRDYAWEDFKLLWESFEKMAGKDEAWKMLHATWQLRAGELSTIHSRLKDEIARLEGVYAELLVTGLDTDEGDIACNEFVESPIDVLNISNRTLYCLRREGIMRIKDLKNYTFEDLKGIRHVGSKALAEIIESLKDSGVGLLQLEV